MKALRAGAFYFAIVFGAGFALGPVRLLWVAPRFGTRTAELMEMPLMLAVILVAARWVIRRLAVPSTPSSRFGMGGVALGLLLTAEVALVLLLWRGAVAEYLAARDPVSGSVYLAMLGLFALAPRFVAYARAPDQL